MFTFGAAPLGGAGGGANNNNNNNAPPAAGNTPAPASNAPATAFAFGSNNSNNNTNANTASTPAPATAAAPSFQFGSTSSNTPAPGSAVGNNPSSASLASAATVPTANPPTFSLGGDSNTSTSTTTAPATTGNAHTPTTANPNPTPAAATTGGGGFSFGGNSSTNTATASGATGTATPAPATSATGGAFSFGGGPPAPAAPGTGTATTGTTAPTPDYVKVEPFDQVFPGLRIYEQVRHQKRFESDTMDLLQTIDSLWKQEQPDMNKRTKLQQQRTVLIMTTASTTTGSQSAAVGNEAHLDDKLLRQVFQLADDLGLTEDAALSLLHQAKKEHTKPHQLYWRERRAPLDALLHLFQSRMAVDSQSSTTDPPVASTDSKEGRLIQATSMLLQQGLVGHLISLIRNYSLRLDTLLDQRRRYMAEASSSFMADDAARARTLRGLNRHIDFGMQQRQTAAEVLFFVAYQYHCDDQNELIPLIQLIRGLAEGTGANNTNNPEIPSGLKPLDPRNVPSAYKTLPTDGNSMAPQVWMEGFGNNAQTKQEEKNPFEWEQELVDQTWEQGHPQLLRCVSTLLMTVVTIMDPNQSLISRRLNVLEKKSETMLSNMTTKVFPLLFQEEWKTPHILGILLASYAMALQATRDPAISSPLSPRNGPTSPFQATAASGSATADVRRAFRTSLEQPAELKTFTFVRYSIIPALQMPSSPSSELDISDFLLSVLTGWTSEYFGLMLAQNPPISRKQWLDDAEEDLRLRRSDQEQYRQFQKWSGTREQLERIPTSVDLLARPDCLDDVLALCYDVCHLGDDFSSVFWDKQDNAVDVAAFIENIYWNDDTLLACYYDLLSSLAMKNPTLVHQLLSGQSLDGNSIKLKTKWLNVADIIRYYAQQLSETKGSGSSLNTSTSTSGSSSQSTMYYYFETDSNDLNRTTSGSKRNSSSSGVRELAEENALILGSHLRLVEVVATRSAEAREYLRDLKLPVQHDRESFTEILFTLSALPMSPELRGMVFEAIASITAGSTPNQVKDAWIYVEDLGILPIHKLLVYPVQINEATAPCLKFPPSSTARINEKHCKSWIPANPRYSLLYEMEYIEASRGTYPATAGFLRLLKELILAGGFPPDLGNMWRSRFGCSPYIEYVIHLVLPRFVGTFARLPALPCRSDGDKDRILSLGLEVVSACLKRYVVPLFALDQEPSLERSLQEMQRTSLDQFSLPSLSNDLVLPISADEFRMFLMDFLGSVPSQGNAETQALANQLRLNTNVPKSKSPGFLVLSELVNRTGSTTLSVIHKILAEGQQNVSGVDRFFAAYAAYGATPPTITSAKAGDSYAMKNLLLPLRTLDEMNTHTASDSWKKRTTSLLEILCGAASREKLLGAALDVYKDENVFIPVVQFRSKPSAPSATEIQVAQIGQLLHDEIEIRPVVELIGRGSGDVAITRAACGFLFYLDSTKQQVKISKDLLVLAMSRLVVQTGKECDDQSRELLSTVLSRSIPHLKAKQYSPLLGIPDQKEGLDAMMHILDAGLIRLAPDLASSCYEGCYYSMQFQNTAQYLRSKNWWLSNFNTLVDLLPQCTNTSAVACWSCLSWVLKGLASELHILRMQGFVAMPMDATNHGPDRYAAIKNALFNQKKLCTIIEMMEIPNAALSDQISESLLTIVGTVLIACKTFKDNVDVSGVLEDLIAKMATTSNGTASKNMAEAVFQIVDYQHAALQSYRLSDYFGLLVPLISRGGPGGVIIANALANTVLRFNEYDSDDLGPRGEFYSAIFMLLRQSCAVSQQIPAVPSSEALAARCSLKVLLPIMDNNDLRRVMTDQGDFGRSKTALSAWVDLLSRADQAITPLLELLGLFPFGVDSLLDADILRALDSAGDAYDRHIQHLAAQSLSTERIALPHYWEDHLNLMSSLMVNASRNRRMEAANHVLSVLGKYNSVAERVLRSFPTDGDAANSFLRCSAIAVDLAKPNQFSGPSSIPITIPSHKMVCLLALQIAENPLPPAVLRPLPKALSKGGAIQSNMASIDASETKSWWDSLEKDESAVRFYAIQGASAARTALSLAREGSKDLIAKLDCLSIARGLCRHVDAFHMIRLSPSGSTLDPSENEMRELKKLFGEIVFALLRLSIEVLLQKKERYSSSMDRPWEEVTLPLKIALDYTRLDATGLYDDENKRDMVVRVSSRLRQLFTVEY